MRIVLLLVLVVGGALSVGAGYMLKGTGGAPEVTPVDGDWALSTPGGQQVSAQTFRGQWSLIYFGYTFCPDICPTELSLIGNALDGLGESASQVAPYFITVDPQRDTMEKISQYAPYFHERIVPLWGDETQVRRCADEFDVIYSRVNLANSDHYLMNHTSETFLVNPSGVIVERFPYQYPVNDMVTDIRNHLN